MSLPLSGSQTVGPYFAIGLSSLCSEAVACDRGYSIAIEGQMLDGDGLPIPDGLLEIWQADSNGEYKAIEAVNSAEAIGFGRFATDANGRFRLRTVKPGPVPYGAGRMQAPHLLVLVYMRGLLRHLVTRLYFSDEPANRLDPVLEIVPAERRSTLIAQAVAESGTFHWDIVMRQQNPDAKPETVFFLW